MSARLPLQRPSGSATAAAPTSLDGTRVKACIDNLNASLAEVKRELERLAQANSTNSTSITAVQTALDSLKDSLDGSAKQITASVTKSLATSVPAAIAPSLSQLKTAIASLSILGPTLSSQISAATAAQNITSLASSNQFETSLNDIRTHLVNLAASLDKGLKSTRDELAANQRQIATELKASVRLEAQETRDSLTSVERKVVFVETTLEGLVARVGEFSTRLNGVEQLVQQEIESMGRRIEEDMRDRVDNVVRNEVDGLRRVMASLLSLSKDSSSSFPQSTETQFKALSQSTESQFKTLSSQLGPFLALLPALSTFLATPQVSPPVSSAATPPPVASTSTGTISSSAKPRRQFSNSKAAPYPSTSPPTPSTSAAPKPQPPRKPLHNSSNSPGGSSPSTPSSSFSRSNPARPSPAVAPMSAPTTPFPRHYHPLQHLPPTSVSSPPQPTHPRVLPPRRYPSSAPPAQSVLRKPAPPAPSRNRTKRAIPQSSSFEELDAWMVDWTMGGGAGGDGTEGGYGEGGYDLQLGGYEQEGEYGEEEGGCDLQLGGGQGEQAVAYDLQLGGGRPSSSPEGAKRTGKGRLEMRDKKKRRRIVQDCDG